MATVATEDDAIRLSPPILHHVPFQRNRRVGLVVDTKPNRQAGLFRTDLTVDALTLYRDYQARFPLEFLFREATPCTGVTDGQARAQAKRTLPCNARLRAVTLATLDARPPTGAPASAFARASLKRRACNQPLLEPIAQP